MPLSTGTRLGPYEIVAAIGAGGMGEVHRAHDSRLGRDVAIKTCPPESGSAERQARFAREARAVAALSHPHICAVYDVGSEAGLDYIVMELLAGETLASRLTRGPVPLSEALEHARQMAGALAAAHAAGIIHRDLKPQNVMLTERGVKLLDFGLAVRSATADSATGTALTRPGMVAGTVPYMAPEQIEGRAVDARADVFAFGATVFEMVAGRRAFPGDTPAAVMTSILRDEPPAVSSIVPVPPSFDRLIAACLAKAPEARWHCADDLCRALGWVGSESTAAPAAAPAPQQHRWRAAAALLAMAGAGAALGWLARPAPVERPADRRIYARIDPPRGESFIVPDGPPGTVQLALSNDGSALAFVATSAGGQMLYRRRVDGAESERIAGTEGALFPMWAPDNRTLAFFTATEVKVVGNIGEPPRTLARVVHPFGGTWVDDRQLLVSSGGTIVRIAVPDGRVETVLARSTDTRAFVGPVAVPGQSWFLVAEHDTQTPHEPAVITARDADGRLLGTLLKAHSRAVLAGPRTLAYVRNGIAFAQDFDPSTATLRGAPHEVVSDVGGATPAAWASLTASPRGDLAYAVRVPPHFPLRAWSRTGQLLAELADRAHSPSLSPDSRFVAMRRHLSAETSAAIDLYLLDIARGVSQRLTFDAPADSSPVWAPDGRSLVYSSMRQGLDDLWLKGIGPGPGSRIAQGPVIPTDWSPDGRLVAFHSTRTSAAPWGWQFDIGVASASAPHQLTGLTDTPFQEVHPRFSPNGRWIAYASNESGAFEIYLQPYPPDGRRVPVSSGGGSEPVWRRDGTELFYLAPDGHVMRVPMAWDPNPAPGAPARLFRLALPPLSLPYRPRYAVSGDGQQFVALHESNEEGTAIHLIVHWQSPASGG
jgi:Tol biopolymer transport system component